MLPARRRKRLRRPLETEDARRFAVRPHRVRAQGQHRRAQLGPRVTLTHLPPSLLGLDRAWIFFQPYGRRGLLCCFSSATPAVSPQPRLLCLLSRACCVSSAAPAVSPQPRLLCLLSQLYFALRAHGIQACCPTARAKCMTSRDQLHVSPALC